MDAPSVAPLPVLRDVRFGPRISDLSPVAAPDSGCTTIWVSISPAQLQVGLIQFPSNAFIAPPGYSPGVGIVMLQVMIDGKPASGRVVELEVRSAPATGGHAHLKTTKAPTAWLSSYVTITDVNGMAKVRITAGYRGGFEIVAAKTQVGEKWVEGSAAVQIRVPGLSDIKQSQGAMGTSPAWPFIYIGATPAHPDGTNHYFRTSEMGKLVGVLYAGHKLHQSMPSGAAAGWVPGRLCALRLNDASLPLGGRFGSDGNLPNNADAYRAMNGAPASKVAQDPNPERSHKRHDRGLSLDVDRRTADGCTLNYTIFGELLKPWGGVAYDEDGHMHIELPDPKHPAYVKR